MQHTLFVLSGPSSVGKTTILKKLFEQLPELQKAVSFTTRKQRRGSVEDKIMHYTTPEEFRKMIDNREFIEWAQVYHNYYGTHRKTLEELLEKGPVILNLDVQGSLQIKERLPGAILIFILPDSIEVLKKRLRERLARTHDEADMEARIAEAEHEISLADQFHYQVINKTGALDDAVAAVRNIIMDNMRG